jgi:hypothetical protein
MTRKDREASLADVHVDVVVLEQIDTGSVRLEISQQ